MQDILRHGISHDYQDVLEFAVEGILAWYGWYPVLTDRDRSSLGAWLLGIGGWYQTREIARVVEVTSKKTHLDATHGLVIEPL